MDKARHEEIRNNWLCLFQKQKDSGLTIEEFCRIQGIPPTSFRSAMQRYIKPNESGKKVSLVPVAVQQPAGKVTVTINGIALSYDSGTSPEDLQSVVSCLVKL